jgi:tripartite-type tricarboxylate transporter receptor subunit TctC
MTPTDPRRRRLNAALAAAGLCLGLSPLRARAASDLKALQIVVPTPPGSQPDLIARWLLEPLAGRAGLPGTVSNRPGAAGAIAADAVLAAPPDSGTLLIAGLDHVAYSHLNSNRRALDPFGDFVPVGAVNRDTWVVATGATQPVRGLAELIERSRGQGPLNYASTGEGSTAHLLAARLCKTLGIEAQHVPYKDPWMPDLIAGRIHFVVAPTPAVLGQIRGGRLQALATLTDERLAVLNGVPTVRELGWPDQVFYGGLFMFAPAALAPRAADINRWLVETLAQPDIVQRYRDAAIEPTPLGLAQVHESVRQRLQTTDAMRTAVFGRTR